VIAVYVYLRAESRRRWRAWLSLALLVGTFAGVVMAAVAGARRTDSAYPRLVAWSKPPDMVVFAGEAPGFVTVPRATLARLPQVARAASALLLSPIAPGGVNMISPADGQMPGSFWRRKVLVGRLASPGRADEVNVSFTLAQERHLQVGDLLRIKLLTKRGKPVTFAFSVTGIDAAPIGFPPQVGTGEGLGYVWATRAFSRTHGAELQAFHATALRLRHGNADVAEATREMARLAHGHVGTGTFAGESANTQRSIHLQAVALWLLAALLALTGVLVLAQLFARLSFIESAEYGALRAVGMGRGQLTAVGLGRALVIGASGAGVAVMLPVALSPLLPVGLAGLAEPHPGVAADWPVLAAGALATVLTAVGCAVWPAWTAAAGRRAPSTVPSIGTPSGPVTRLVMQLRPGPGMLGARLALQPGAGPTALPVATTVAGAAIGIAALSASLVFSASLGHLLATPRLYGVTWDASVATDSDRAPLTAAIKTVAGNPQVAAWSAGYAGIPVRIGGLPTEFMAMSQRRGTPLMPVPVAGRLPQRPGEIVLGTRTLAAMHARIGTVIGASILGSAPTRLRIVGTAVFPTVSAAIGLGQGAAVTVGGLHQLMPPGVGTPFDTLLIRFAPGVDAQAARYALVSRLAYQGPFIVREAQKPTDLVNFGGLQSLPMLVGTALSALALATIAHLLTTSVRRRRRDFAILRAIGFTRGQIRRVVAWQAATLTSVALMIGVPAGVLCGRAVWLIFAHHLGILPGLSIPLGQFAVVAAGAIVLAVAIAALPGESAARARPSQALRSE